MVEKTELDAARLLERLVIRGLHGYKDVEIAFPKTARIVIAENGSGKTTVLSALSLLLNKDLYELRRLPFDSIELDLVGQDKTLELVRSQIELGERGDDLVKDMEAYVDAPVSRIIQSVLETGNSRRWNSVVDEFHRRSPYSREEVLERVASIRRSFDELLPDSVKTTMATIESALSGVRVLHLPTYRRIEAPLERQTQQRRRPWQRGLEFDQPWKHSPFVGRADIRYGLADVDRRLQDLASEIQRISNIGYRQLSANIIDDLLKAGTSALTESSKTELPDLESLKLFLSRVEAERPRDKRTEALAELYDDARKESTYISRTLKYFLSKLAVVVNQTKELESNIASFVDRVNSYLTLSSEEKRLNYDATDMRVEVLNTWTGRPVEMDDLSSGEKQVISLFSYLYLYEGSNLVLIDEPELSLSIEWQKMLLPDIVGTPTCVQLLAITHSPFIFDNSLDPVAGPMVVQRRRKADG